MLETITVQMAVELLRLAVQTKGRDFRYRDKDRFPTPRTCSYLPLTDASEADADDPRRTTGCLIGVALDIYGATEHHNNPTSSIGFLYNHNPSLMTYQAMDVFTVAQSWQDDGYTWGEALDAAIETANLRIRQGA